MSSGSGGFSLKARPFLVKAHGAGNDFLLAFGSGAAWIEKGGGKLVAALCRRRTGIGADGVVVMRASGPDSISLRYFNSDGSEAVFCANGTRCAALAAHSLMGMPPALKVESAAGIISAYVTGEDSVRLLLDPPSISGEEAYETSEARTFHGWKVMVGVPHLVVKTEDVDHLNVEHIGKELRTLSGANVNFMVRREHRHWQVRTFERGVEAETLACGSGILACGWVAGTVMNEGFPIKITSRLGYGFLVSLNEQRAELEGHAELVGLVEPLSFHEALTW